LTAVDCQGTTKIVHIIWVTFPLLECTAVALLTQGHGMIVVDWWVDV